MVLEEKNKALVLGVFFKLLERCKDMGREVLGIDTLSKAHKERSLVKKSALLLSHLSGEDCVEKI